MNPILNASHMMLHVAYEAFFVVVVVACLVAIVSFILARL